ncbi:MAG: hypothetical protein JNM21_05090 [Taibaiella sp.]|nr:hypothetical protein [Taibaiella sp.]
MVRVTNYESRTTQEGKQFFVLVLQGEVELVQSSETGKMYATVKKANLPCTFDELTCQALIGKELAGSIEKVDCEPYEYINPQTGEVILLSHRQEYVPEKSKSSKEIVQ